MINKGLRLLLHTAIWLTIYLLPFILSNDKFILSKLFNVRGEIIHSVSTILLIVYAYLNYHLLVPTLYLQRKYFVYGVVVVGCLLLVIWFPQAFRGRRIQSKSAFPMSHYNSPSHNNPPHDGPPQNDWSHDGPLQNSFNNGKPPDGPMSSIISKISYNVILFILSTFMAISVRQQRQLLETQKEKTDAELSFLKAQINPHFLFNTLNSIYALAITKSNDTPKAIIQLSELMRYILKDSDADTVPLDKELNYISNYVALQKQRLEDTVRITYTAPVGVANRKVAPLILTSFVENAFKHGVNPSQDSVITISISLQNNRLHLLVTNNKVTSINQSEAMGIGLKNATSRLKHLYPGKHLLSIEDGAKTFSVNLILELND